MCPQDRRINLNLLDNAIDFILRGVDELFDEKYNFRGYVNPREISIRSYKYGSLHIFAGFLLLLKERLYRYNPDLILVRRSGRQVNHPVVRIRTIDYKTSINLLGEHVNFRFSDEDLMTIEIVKDFRDSLEHYKIEGVDIVETWLALSRFLRIIDVFLMKELHLVLEDLPEAIELFGKIQHISTVAERIERQRKDEWYKDARERAKKLLAIRDETLNLKDDDVEEDVLDVFNEELIICPECFCDTLVATGEFTGICLNRECGDVTPVGECSRCETLTEGFPWEVNFCDSCEIDLDSE